MDALLGGLAVAQVAHDGHALALAIALQRAHDELDRDARAVAVQDGRFVAQSRRHCGSPRHLGALVLGHEGHRASGADHLVVRIAHSAQRRLTSVMMPSTVEEDALDGGVEDFCSRVSVSAAMRCATRKWVMSFIITQPQTRPWASNCGIRWPSIHPAAIGGLQVALVAGGLAGAAAAPSG